MAVKSVMVDTSSWIEALRASGSKDIRERVRILLVNGLATWCDMVTVELWNGARGAYEKSKLAELEKAVPCLSTTPEVWDLARKLAIKCRRAGKTVPSADLVIASCALYHGAVLEHCDEHMDLIMEIHGRKR